MPISIKGIDKAEVLAALYNASRQQGMGFMNQRGQSQMTIEDARKAMDDNPGLYFDYLHGRVMKIDLKDDELEEWLYDRDNGKGAAYNAIKHLLQQAA